MDLPDWAEVNALIEEGMPSKPRRLWENALKAVKGDGSAELVEQFTAEMTLVAEGLVEDQTKLREAVDSARKEQERLCQKLQSGQEALETTIRENQRDIDRRLDEMNKRIQALEAQAQAAKSAPKKEKNAKQGLIAQLTVLVAIACGSWVLVTLLNLLH